MRLIWQKHVEQDWQDISLASELWWSVLFEHMLAEVRRSAVRRSEDLWHPGARIHESDGFRPAKKSPLVSTQTITMIRALVATGQIRSSLDHHRQRPSHHLQQKPRPGYQLQMMRIPTATALELLLSSR